MRPVCNERGAKGEVYKYLQGKTSYCDLDAVARKVITDMLVNSIADNKNYVTSDTEQILYNKFFNDDMEQNLSDSDILIKLRLIYTYYQYLCFFKGDQINKEFVKLQWRRIKLKNSEYEYWRKAILAAEKPEINDLNKYYEYYCDAIKKVY